MKITDGIQDALNSSSPIMPMRGEFKGTIISSEIEIDVLISALNEYEKTNPNKHSTNPP